MDGWIVKWMDGWMCGWMVELMDGWVESSNPVVGRSFRDREVPGSIPTRRTANFLEQDMYFTPPRCEWVPVSVVNLCAAVAHCATCKKST